MEREKEIIKKVNLWRDKFNGGIIHFNDNKRKSIDKEMVLIFALLQHKNKCLDLVIERESIHIVVLNRKESFKEAGWSTN